MFNSKYFKTRFIYELEETGYKVLMEPNYKRRECFVFIPDAEKEGNYLIYLRKLDKKPLDSKRIYALDEFLLSYGYSDYDFINPFNRTKKLVQELDKINNLEKDKAKIKK